MKKFLHRREGRKPSPSDQSFVGGIPAIPAGTSFPKCLVCGADLTSFLQVAFPPSHPWQGHSLAIFACTSTADPPGSDEHMIPDMIKGGLKGIDVSRDFLQKYQRTFRILVFETERGEMMRGYVERVAFAPLELESKKQGAIGFLNDKPKWVIRDETPATVAGSRAVFLFELFGDITFPTVDRAPPQIERGIDGEPEPSLDVGLYRLFLSNHIYFFGPTTPDSAVYVLTQRD